MASEAKRTAADEAPADSVDAGQSGNFPTKW